MSLPELPQHIQEAIKERTDLEWELQGIGLTNTYGQSAEFMIELNSRMVQVQRRLAELYGKINSYIEAGKIPRHLL
jgi:hypothetical protein